MQDTYRLQKNVELWREVEGMLLGAYPSMLQTSMTFPSCLSIPIHAPRKLPSW